MTTIERVQKIIASVLHVPLEDVVPHAQLYQLADFDSMHLTEIAAGLDEEFQTRIPNDRLDGVLSVQDLARLVDELPSA